MRCRPAGAAAMPRAPRRSRTACCPPWRPAMPSWSRARSAHAWRPSSRRCKGAITARRARLRRPKADPMLYWLSAFSDLIGPLNVLRYITFRTGGAMMTAMVFVFLFGPWLIDHLRIKQGKGQPIRTDGPQSHLVTKKGTPTMGGLMILSGIVVSTLLWANLANRYVWIVLGVMLSFGVIGFYDDYLKVTKQ